MIAGTAPWMATAALAAFFAGTASADIAPRLHEGRALAAHPEEASSPGAAPPPQAQVSPGAPEVTSPRQAAAARPRVEAAPSPFTMATTALMALLIVVTVLALVITLRSLRKDIRRRRRV